MEICTICSEVSRASVRSAWNQPLLESDNFLVVPSLGSLVAGWTLLLPKQHYLSFGALPPSLRDEAELLEAKTERLLRSRFGRAITKFEHGPSAAKHGTGCGVDHAHLHLLPLNCDLRAEAQPFLPASTEWVSAGWQERSSAYLAGLDYLFVEQDGQAGVISVSSDFGSQIFRKAIANHLGRLTEFNWREHPKYEVATQTALSLITMQINTCVECEHA